MHAVLELAQDQPFARVLINSGRLSTPTPYLHSPLNTPDEDEFRGAMCPGTPCADAPIGRADGTAGALGALVREREGLELERHGDVEPAAAGGGKAVDLLAEAVQRREQPAVGRVLAGLLRERRVDQRRLRVRDGIADDGVEVVHDGVFLGHPSGAPAITRSATRRRARTSTSA